VNENNSPISVEIIGNEWFAEEAVVAGFSTANRHHSMNEHTIVGLDLGINTASDLQITSRNRSLLLEEIGLNPNSLAFARQVHGTRIRCVDEPGCYPDTDGLITNVRGVTLGILVADCAAVLISDASAGVIGAFHAGWRGAAGGILQSGLSLMRELGGSNFRVWVSPCIGLQSFEVGEEVAKAFPEIFVHREGFDKPHIDLPEFIRHTLMDSGVDATQIQVDGRCTFSDENYFSFRRQKERSGRMMGIIALK
jgi:polyphenol oxidase